MTTEYSNIKDLKKVLLSRKEYLPFPKYEDRESWAKVNPELRARYLNDELKKKVLEYDSSALTATGYMDLYRTGRRGGKWYDTVMSRRDILWQALLAECFEGKGEYIDKIIDLVWAVCEETSWVIPPHNNHMHNHMLSGVNKNALPDILDYNFIDLYSGITATILGWVYYFLKDRLDKETVLVSKRIEIEITKKIIIPFMMHDDMTWFGFYGHKINNWNPWIMSSIIPVCLIVIKDEDLRLEFMSRALEKFDIYVNNCAPDGGSDEGPGYWNVGGGACLDVFEIINDATSGKINLLKTDFARNVAEYIAHANMTGNLYANFGDNGMHYSVGYYAYRYAKLCNSDYLMSYALSKPNVKVCPNLDTNTTYRHLKCLFEYGDVLSEKQTEFVHKDVWLPDTEHLYVNSSDGEVALAAKFGYNNESHNHNDIGTFIYCVDGEAALCDPGSPVYSDKTFSPQRYEIWVCTSAAHCCAEINGFDQHNGDEFKSKILQQSMDDKCVMLKAELKKAYEEEAGIAHYTREFVFDKLNGELSVTDDIELYEASDNLSVHYITARDVFAGNDKAVISLLNGKKVELSCNDGYYALTDEHYFEEGHLRDAWKSDYCKRILFKPKAKSKHHTIKVKIKYFCED